MRGTDDAAAACANLKSAIAAALIGLPSGDANIESATLIGPSDFMVLPKPPFSPTPPEIGVMPATPEYCKVIGAIAPVDPKAPPIRVHVNLPTQWSGSSVQFGGGGFNGVLISGLGLPPSARPDRASPLMRGFVTYGTDSGHQNTQGVPLQAFALPFAVTLSRPMCRYPAFPRYRGNGDPRVAEGFECITR